MKDDLGQCFTYKYRDICTHILALPSYLKIATTIATIVLSMCADPLLRDLVEPGQQEMKITPLHCKSGKYFVFKMNLFL